MRWNNQESPLDRTIDALDRLSVVMRATLEHNEPPTVDDFRAILSFVDELRRQLKPLQDARVQEQR